MQRIFPVSVLFIFSLLLVTPSYAFDSANDSTVDKADRFEFEEFHKDDAVTLWGKDKKEDKKAVTTHEEPTYEEPKTENPANTTKKYDKGQELKVRSEYKLSADPSLSAIPTLFEAIQSLHQQLNNYCSNGWEKEKEWHKPEANFFYIHYRAICL